MYQNFERYKNNTWNDNENLLYYLLKLYNENTVQGQ